jgi:hypothetical protein
MFLRLTHQFPERTWHQWIRGDFQSITRRIMMELMVCYNAEKLTCPLSASCTRQHVWTLSIMQGRQRAMSKYHWSRTMAEWYLYKRILPNAYMLNINDPYQSQRLNFKDNQQLIRSEYFSTRNTRILFWGIVLSWGKCRISLYCTGW